jgi:hypothetical protein
MAMFGKKEKKAEKAPKAGVKGAPKQPKPSAENKILSVASYVTMTSGQ